SASSLFTLLIAPRRQIGNIVVRCVSTAGASAEAQLNAYLNTICEGVAAPRVEIVRTAWLAFALHPFPDLFASPRGGVRVKVKDALLKKALTARQVQVVHDYLTDPAWDGTGGIFGLASYGCEVNRVPRRATAASQREAI